MVPKKTAHRSRALFRLWKRIVWYVPVITGLVMSAPILAEEAGGETSLGNVLPGIDVLIERDSDLLAGKRVGLITNHTGLTREGTSTIDILFTTDRCKLAALFCPEHGIRGVADELVASGRDEKTGLAIHSLYGKTQKPTPQMLEGLDVLVFDIQDIGTRFYTYIGTMSLAMEAARDRGIGFVVLDRPNPIGGLKVEGAIPSGDLTGGITCIHPIPTRHGMTVGELALLFNKHFGIGCNLEVIPMKNWERGMYYEQTGLPWAPTSPNMKTINGAILYPGLGVSEATWLSCGRGTDRPFEIYGAPYFDSERIIANLAARNTPGVRFVPVSFTPSASGHKFQGETCQGVQAVIEDRDTLDSVTTGLHMIQAIFQTHPTEYRELPPFRTLTGDNQTWRMLAELRESPEEIVASWRPRLEEFLEVRKRYLLY
jgi:uncharacterized protein YbbC (DUF1343 family)